MFWYLMKEAKFVSRKKVSQLELVFIKHYAPQQFAPNSK